jgi:hypothetical protein
LFVHDPLVVDKVLPWLADPVTFGAAVLAGPAFGDPLVADVPPWEAEPLVAGTAVVPAAGAGNVVVRTLVVTVPTTYAEEGHVGQVRPGAQEVGSEVNEVWDAVPLEHGPLLRSRRESAPRRPSTATQ